MKNTLRLIFVITFVGMTVALLGQEKINHSGAWLYEVKNTPYGNFYGTIYLMKKVDTYEGKIINKQGLKYSLDVIRIRGNKMVFTSNIEDTNSVLTCQFKGDSLFATVEVKGDSFLYKLRARRSASTGEGNSSND